MPGWHILPLPVTTASVRTHVPVRLHLSGLHLLPLLLQHHHVPVRRGLTPSIAAHHSSPVLLLQLLLLEVVMDGRGRGTGRVLVRGLRGLLLLLLSKGRVPGWTRTRGIRTWPMDHVDGTVDCRRGWWRRLGHGRDRWHREAIATHLLMMGMMGGMVTATVVSTATARAPLVHGIQSRVTTTTTQVTHLLSVIRVATFEQSLLLLLVVVLRMGLLLLLLLVLVWIVVPLVMCLLLLLLLQVLVMWWIIAITTTAVEIRLACTGRGR